LEDKTFLTLVAAVSIAFAMIIVPFFGAILWALIAAIVFFPLKKRLLRAMPTHRNRVALMTLLVIVAAVILPALVLVAFLVQEASGFYTSVQAGEIDFDRYFVQIQGQIPGWLNNLLKPFGLTDLDATLAKLGAVFASKFEILAAHALDIGQVTLGFLLALVVTLYLTFFLLRDGEELSEKVSAAVPLSIDHRRALIDTFVTVIRATIKGSLVVAILQGLIGGLLFWALGIHAPLLCGVAMAVLAFLPVVGTGLVWLPVAIYLLATGAILQGVVLLLCGTFIIGMVDNVVRPILVGRDTRLPDWLVLVSTLGGLAALGANGVVVGPVVAALFVTVWRIFSATRASAVTVQRP